MDLILLSNLSVSKNRTSTSINNCTEFLSHNSWVYLLIFVLIIGPLVALFSEFSKATNGFSKLCRGVAILRNRYFKEFLYQSPLSSHHILSWYYVSTNGSVRKLNGAPLLREKGVQPPFMRDASWHKPCTSFRSRNFTRAKNTPINNNDKTTRSNMGYFLARRSNVLSTLC